jgi:glycosyltransferase involved in cell wall biosynthesis
MPPHLTVLIATHQRAGSLEAVLSRLGEQRLPENPALEALIVDNNSRDRTRQVVETFAAAAPFPVRYLFESRQGKVHALNNGIEVARGEWIVFTDDDCRLDPNWLAGFWKAIAAHPKCDAFGGRILPHYPEDCPAWIQRYAAVLNGPIPLHDYGERTHPYDDAMLPFLGANIAARRAALLAVGMFDPRRNYVAGASGGRARGGEDTDLFRRLQAAGRRIAYCGGALVHHPVGSAQCRLGYIARWQVAHGENYAEEPETGTPTLAAVPRWLYRRLIGSALETAVYCFDGERRLRAFLETCRCWGIFREYRRRARDAAAEDRSRT